MELYERITGSPLFRPGTQKPHARDGDDIESLIWTVAGKDPAKFIRLHTQCSISECLLAAAMLVNDPPQIMRFT